MKTSLVFLAACAAFALTGCVNLPEFKAREVHRTMSYPLVFTDQVDAIDITKKTNPDGTVTRTAGTVTHTTTIGGFTRSAVYKDAEIVETPDAK